MFKLKSNNIIDFPFQNFRGLNNTEMEDLAVEYGIRNHNSWMLPQIVAYFGSWKPVMTEGLVDTLKTATSNLGDNLWSKGLLRVCTKLKRSSLVKAQNTAEFASYSALVPLVMSGLKKFHNINYRSWTKEGLEHLVDEALWKAMTYVPPEFSKEEILELRTRGLTIKSGPKAGELHNPISTWKLSKLVGPDFPPLYTTMLGQIWVAHPSLRSQYMVLDPRDWDKMPDPLITTDVFTKTAKITQPAPWE